ncbi:sulfatase family protein [Rhodopirellula sallentina]|uniref:N-acetylgalactosamine 6-sulfate sulfatase (GALNS) n=1 Tax=Rhodopirellula sallentina SM41 TaxID=1263870 RepID=M5U7P6_9BACT|nr:sulfatase [Rhodopirellula sallentina]EMI57465.1 N-acetylgalactosamine 6-sulfate sulfatase (GALNS) [Rhodopirellula sallentina SM41]
MDFQFNWSHGTFVRFQAAIIFLVIGSSAAAVTHAETSPPNFVIVFADDLGYGDLGCFGATKIKTPNLDQMAEEGIRFTDFYAQTVCGPSRAALMTGCYPLRVAIEHNRVEVHPHLHSEEITIAEVLAPLGYQSIAIGKWDLAGHSQLKFSPHLLPTHQGFNRFFGTPSSNDSIVNLLKDEKIVEKRANMSQLTRRYTDAAIDFIKENKQRPFFVYLAHSMPHVKLAVSKQFAGKSAGGLYGDVIEELDFHVGRLLDFLEEEGLDENTYVIFTSDNGPWFFGRSKGHIRRFGDDAVSYGGSAAPLRGAKTSTWEGGLRVPFIARAPKRIPAGSVCREVASTMDLMPTLAKLAGGQPPTDRVIDGKDIRPLLHAEPNAESPTEAYFFYRRTRLEAVRSGNWKLVVPTPVDKTWAHYSKASDAIEITQPMLFNLESDIGETKDVAASHPEIVATLMKHIDRARHDIGDHDRIGEHARFFDDHPRRPDIMPPSENASANQR